MSFGNESKCFCMYVMSSVYLSRRSLAVGSIKGYEYLLNMYAFLAKRSTFRNLVTCQLHFCWPFKDTRILEPPPGHFRIHEFWTPAPISFCFQGFTLAILKIETRSENGKFSICPKLTFSFSDHISIFNIATVNP